MNDAIRTSGLTKSFGTLTAVDHLDLTIPAGQVVALLGPNGAGKSTTTEMILGLSTPDAGTIEIFGGDPVEAVRRGEVGAMLQSGPLLEGVTVRGLLQMMAGLHTHPLPVPEVVERAGIADILATRTEKLSGGQAQRVRFALAILPDPRLLLLDEPTVAMDVGTRREFWAQMREVATSGRTVVFATHYLDEADEFAERIIMMARGRVVADDTGAAIKQQVAGRAITFLGEDSAELGALAGVTGMTRSGDRIRLHSTDSDATLRALLASPHPASEIDIETVSLEDAFLRLTDETLTTEGDPR
ncbi:ABC transporter ATP-binding protein [Enemella evansiae]|uniref:ABC transporter ATP-binding protein n=1 Tax=Enemella evansiae TaxID=2016499 RepID=UPI000B960D1E|nr:ABC transporter ATP-binding protein [Enemella evansiae]OYO07800.1 ABC transporter ATP-binding protein [Enemella evansiae]